MSVAAATVMFGTLLAGSLPVYAADSTTTTKDTFVSGLVKFIAQKFNLDETKVKAAIDEYHEKNKPTEADIKAMEKKRLDSLVSEGKITSDQETAILNKLSELRTKYSPDSMKDLSSDERKAKFDAMQAEIKAWAAANGIDESYLRMMGRGRGMMHGRPMGSVPTSTITPASAQ